MNHNARYPDLLDFIVKGTHQSFGTRLCSCFHALWNCTQPFIPTSSNQSKNPEHQQVSTDHHSRSSGYTPLEMGFWLTTTRHRSCLATFVQHLGTKRHTCQEWMTSVPMVSVILPWRHQPTLVNTRKCIIANLHTTSSWKLQILTILPAALWIPSPSIKNTRLGCTASNFEPKWNGRTAVVACCQHLEQSLMVAN